MTDPTIDRFLAAHPELRDAAERVLADAALVRRAGNHALPAGHDRGPNPGPEFAAAQDDLFVATEELEALVCAAGEKALPRDAAAAVDRVLEAAVKVRAESHASSPRRGTTSPAARAELFRVLDIFEKSHADLEEQAHAGHARLPWQIELATHVAPGTPLAEMALWGHSLPRTPASRRTWGERCFFSGRPWNSDSRASPEPRYRSLDSRRHTLSPRYHDLLTRLRAVLDVARKICPEAVGKAVRLFPALYEEYTLETCHPTFQRLGLLDFPSLAVSLNNLLLAHAERPLFGSRRHSVLEQTNERGRFETLGVADRVAVALEERTSGYRWQTYDEVRLLSLRLARSLERLGLAPGDRIGILMSANCREFYLADFAAIFSSLASVGLPDTFSDERLAAVIKSTELRAVVADTAGRERLAQLAFDDKSGVGAPIVVDVVEVLAGEEPPEAWVSSSGVCLATGLIHGDEAGYRTAEAAGISADEDEDIYTLLYTSGSTGTPKGTIATRRRWVEEMCFEANIWPNVGVSFQPSAIAADRGSVWRILSNGGRVGFACRGAGLFHDLRAIRPTIFDAPPVIWNTLYGDYKRAISDPSLSRRDVAEVRRRVRHRLGGRLVFMAVGGAPSDPGVRRTLAEVLGVKMSEGYGTTETGNIAADGHLLPGLDYRLLDLPELGYLSGDKPYPRGELAVKTPRSTARYWNDKVSTREGFTEDGFFRTGDIVEIGPGRRCTILGRRKQTFKLAGSEFVSPEVLEACYLASERVEAMMITASPLKSAVVALVVPVADGITQNQVLADLRRIARREGLRPSAVPVGVVLARRVDGLMPWTPENGLLTPSLKLNRSALEAEYCEAIEDVYTRAESDRAEPVGAIAEATRRDLEGLTQRLARLVATLLAVDPVDVDPSRSFFGLGGDSLTSLEFVLRLEQVFPGKGEPHELPVHELVGLPLAEVARRIHSCGVNNVEAPGFDLKSNRRSSPESSPAAVPVAGPDKLSPEELAALANKDALSAPMPNPLPPRSDKDHVLLTGATGFLGVHLLAHLVAVLAPGARIYALVRANSDEAARQRLSDALAGASLDLPAIGFLGDNSRVIVLAGFLSSESLGLSDDAYEHLSAEIGLIHHVAAEVSFGKSYADLRHSNVDGTRRMLDLATRTTLKTLHFVSSLNVALLIRQATGERACEEAALPDRLTAPVVAAQPGYAVSKWVCESMIRQLFVHSRRAFRVSISRPALIIWSRTTGRVNESDWLPRVLATCLATRSGIGSDEAGVLQWVPETPVSTRGLDLVPVDYVASAVHRIAERTRASKLPGPTRTSWNPVPTFHVSNLAPEHTGHVTMPRLMDLLIVADLRWSSGESRAIELVPFDEWAYRAEMEKAPVLSILGQLRSMSPAIERTEAGRFALLMEGAAEAPPAVDLELTEALVRWPTPGL